MPKPNSATLADLVNQWTEDYSVDEFLELYMPNFTFGDIVWFMYEVGEIPSTSIDKFLNEGEEDE